MRPYALRQASFEVDIVSLGLTRTERFVTKVLSPSVFSFLPPIKLR